MELLERINQIEASCSKIYQKIDEIALTNQKKVLDAFKSKRLALQHFSGSSGYGYGDAGRDKLNEIYAEIFGTEAALVSPLITGGTHALSICLYGLLRPNDTMLSITGAPYDTLIDVIKGKGDGSLEDFGINYAQIDLLNDKIDYSAVENYLINNQVKLIFIQRSRGYSWRSALSIKDIKDICAFVKNINPNAVILVDNCYGEFVDIYEPTQVGADITAGSLIKNIGGGISPTGGYICGKKHLIDLVSGRFTAPSLKNEVGSYENGYRLFFQGLFLAPHIVAQALKGSALMSAVFTELGFETLPAPYELNNDIITSIKFDAEDQLLAFHRAVQLSSPVDSFVVPYPWDMPGYNHQVIMAAGTFVQGASIELSSDSPIKVPYIAYLQGGLTLEHIKLAIIEIVNKIMDK